VYVGLVKRVRLHLLGLLALTLGACGGAEPARSVPAATGVAPAAAGAAPTEPTFAAAMVSPLTKETPLQIVAVFAYEAGETLISPATELLGLIANPRAEGGFGKDPLRTLLLDPAPAPVKARRLLFVALGARSDFSLERVKAVGATAMRETIRLGVEHMAFAPIARDQGVTTLPPNDVAAAFVEAALVEYQVERRATPDKPVRLQDVTYEAGPPFIDAVTRAVAQGVAAAHTRVRESVP
jgi:hypothetical protein